MSKFQFMDDMALMIHLGELILELGRRELDCEDTLVNHDGTTVDIPEALEIAGYTLIAIGRDYD